MSIKEGASAGDYGCFCDCHSREVWIKTSATMKRLSLSGLGLLSILVLGACETEMEEVEVRERDRGGFRPTSEQRRNVVVEGEERTTERDRGSSTTTTETTTTPSTTTEVVETPATTSPAAPVANYDYGKQVPGKPGFVTSPHSPYSGYVDVRGFPPGTEVKDPYTGKIFLVP